MTTTFDYITLNKKWKIMTQILSIPPTPTKKGTSTWSHLSSCWFVTRNLLIYTVIVLSEIICSNITLYPQNSGFAMNVVPHKIILCVMLAMQLPSPTPTPTPSVLDWILIWTWFICYRTLHNYLLWHMVSSLTSYLSKPFRNAKKILTEALSGDFCKD